MRKRCVLFFLMAVFVIGIAGLAFAQTPEESLRQNFPQLKFDKISPTAIKGIYEITISSGVLYYVPETQYIIAGNIFTKDNRNLTQERVQEIQKRTSIWSKTDRRKSPSTRR